MKYLITGSAGFVGNHLIEHILETDQRARVIGVDRTKSSGRSSQTFTIDLLDVGTLGTLIKNESPDFIIHLASFSSVGFSWQDPTASFVNNTNIFLNLLECVRRTSPRSRVLSIGSSEEYGIVSADQVPLSEQVPLRPVSPYAVARVAQEHLGEVYVSGYGMNIVATRSFNHIGVGQTDRFVVGAIARQFAECARGLRQSLSVGNTSVVRDFLDVRDVVRAYGLLLRKGASGEVYNVCSGAGVSVADIIKLLARISGVDPAVTTDPSLVRPVENSIVVGTHDKLRAATGWSPAISLEESLRAIYDDWYKRLGQ